MKIKTSQQVAFRQVVNTYVDYLQLLQIHLEHVKEDITTTTEKLMSAIQEVDAKASEHKNQVEKMIEDVSLNPDEETAKKIQETQDNVEDIIAAALDGGGDTASTDVEEIQQAQKRRQGGKFSKAVEAISILEGNLSGVLMNLMGALGIDDIVGQRIVAITKSTEEVRGSLRASLSNIDQIFDASVFLKEKKEVLQLTRKTCRSLEEADLFGQFFTKNDLESSQFEGNPDDQVAIATEYLEFLSQYTKLVMRYVATVREKIKETLSEATGSVFELSTHSDGSKSHADEMLLGAREDMHKLSDREAEEKKVLESISEGKGGVEKLLAGHLDMPSDMLGEVDSGLTEKMMEMIATLSIEDVLGQRLEHINKEMANLTRFLAHFKKAPSDALVPEKVTEIRHNLLKFIYGQYSSEMEKREFEKVFGKLKESA